MKNIVLVFVFLSIQNICAQNQFIDTTFGTNSGYTISQMASDDFSFSSAVQYNNSIYAVHTKMGGASYLSKYSLNGIIDSTFGSNGFVSINNVGLTDFSSIQGLKQLLVSSDGKLLITSSATIITAGESPDSIISKLNLDGTFDSSYGINGEVFTNFSYGQSLIGNYKYSDDSLLLVYNKQNSQPSETELALLKINAVGSFDSTFGVNGKITLPYDYSGYYPKIARIKDQFVYIYFASVANPDYIKKFDLATSSYDVNFGITGKLIVQDPSTFQQAVSFTIDEINNIYVVGSSYNQNQILNANVIKFTNEVLDLSFGNNGVSQNIIANNITGIYGVERHADKIILIGENNSSTNTEGASFLAQLNLDGTLDANFAENGVLRNEFFDDLNLAFDYIYSEDSIITAGLCPISSGEYRPCFVKYITNNNLGFTSTDKNNFGFYPNPVSSELHFQTPDNVQSIAIYDVRGRLVKSTNVEDNITDLSELTSGLYIVKAQTESKTHTFKLFKV